MSETATVYEIQRTDNMPLTAAQVRAQVNLIQEVMKSVMQDGQHYGVIPGAGSKPTLLKPGAEKLMLTFHLSPDPIVEDLSTPDSHRYRVTCRICDRDGHFLGAGLGEASSNEEKYKWRAAVCPEEFDETPEDRKRKKWKKGYGGGAAQAVNQIRTEPADIANTILKMAKKRSLVDAALTVTGASDIFTQDIEDMPPEMLGGKHQETKEPAKKADTQTDPAKISDAQRKRFYAIAKGTGFSDDEIKAHLALSGIERTSDILKTQYDELCDWAAAKNQGRDPGSEG